jgi:hypothetical protein
MKHYRHFATVVVAVLLGTVFLASNLQARICSGNGDVVGSYGFIGSRDAFFLLGATPPATGSAAGTGPLIPVPVAPPGTVALTGSRTPLGALVTGLSNPNVFSAAGRVFMDGLGNIFASPSASVITNVLAGTYSVGSDCSVIMTLRDPFSSTGAVVTTGTVTLQGELIDSSTGSDSISAVQTGATAAGAVVTFTRLTQFSACTNLSLTSTNYTVAGQGMFLASAGTGVTVGPGGTITGPGGTIITPTPTGAFTSGVTTPLGTAFNLLGRTVVDGAGIFANDASAQTSPVTRNLTGTYTVNFDCTGTATLADSTGVTRGINFVIVNDLVQTTLTGTVTRQALQFVFSDAGVFGTGTARPQ